jgi:hypothetical protein
MLQERISTTEKDAMFKQLPNALRMKISRWVKKNDETDVMMLEHVNVSH